MSPYFKLLISSNFKESRQGYTALNDLPYEMDLASLEAFVRFMYTGLTSHITESKMALEILCNIGYFYSTDHDSTALLIKNHPSLGQSLDQLLMDHCVRIVVDGISTDADIQSLKSIATTLKIHQLSHQIALIIISPQ
jgi:hypothetical protein